MTTCVARGVLGLSFLFVVTSPSNVPAHVPRNVHARTSLHFAVTNRGNLSFALPPSAPLSHLCKSVIEIHKEPLHFSLQLLGDTIASSRSQTNESNQSIADSLIIKSIALDLSEIWGQRFNIPIKVVSDRQPVDDFSSLAQLFVGPNCNIHQFDWFQFILNCAQSQSCSVQDLCDRFSRLFFCDDGKITTIKFWSEEIKGHLDLSFLPKSVDKLLVNRNWFSAIYGLDQLDGKKLQYLDVRGNPLKIDLRLLEHSHEGSKKNPLRSLSVNTFQVDWCLIGTATHSDWLRVYHRRWEWEHTQIFHNRVFEAAKKWLSTSILNRMRIGRKNLLLSDQKSNIDNLVT